MTENYAELYATNNMTHIRKILSLFLFEIMTVYAKLEVSGKRTDGMNTDERMGKTGTER